MSASDQFKRFYHMDRAVCHHFIFHHRMDEVNDNFRYEVQVKGVEAVDEVTEEVEEKRPGPTT